MNVYYLHMYISMHAFVKNKQKKTDFPCFFVFFVTLDEMVVVCVVLIYVWLQSR